MTRARRSLSGPIAFAFCSFVFAAGAAYTWWLDHRARPIPPLTEVRAAPPQALPAPSVVRRPLATAPPAPAPERRARPAPVLRKCLGADGVPIFTSTACPEGARLIGEIPVEVPEAPRSPASPPATLPAPAVAVANATVMTSPGYGIPNRAFRRDVRLEQAWDRCERGKLHADAELAALRLKRKMSDIRRWDDYVVRECAPYEVLTR